MTHLGEENPFTSVVAEPDHASGACLVTWILDIAGLDFSCSDFLIRRSPDGHTNTKYVTSPLLAVPGLNEYSFLDEDAYKGSRGRTWHYQVLLRSRGKAYYSGWVAARGRDPLQFAKKEEGLETDLAITNDADVCYPLNLGEDLSITSAQRTRFQEDGFLNKQELGIARHIMNLERVHMKRAGTRLFIYKRLLEGDPCTTCRDGDTGQILNPNCVTCYNTGIIGGYDEPVEVYLENITKKTEQVKPRQTGEGEDDKIQYVFRHASDPEIDQFDILLQHHDDVRFVVEKVDKFQFRGKQPLVSHITVSLVQRDNIIYNIPLGIEKKEAPIPLSTAKYAIQSTIPQTETAPTTTETSSPHTPADVELNSGDSYIMRCHSNLTSFRLENPGDEATITLSDIQAVVTFSTNHPGLILKLPNKEIELTNPGNFTRVTTSEGCDFQITFAGLGSLLFTIGPLAADGFLNTEVLMSGFVDSKASVNGQYLLDGSSMNGQPTYSNGSGWFMFYDGSEWIITDTAYDKSGSWVSNGSHDIGNSFYRAGPEFENQRGIAQPRGSSASSNSSNSSSSSFSSSSDSSSSLSSSSNSVSSLSSSRSSSSSSSSVSSSRSSSSSFSSSSSSSSVSSSSMSSSSNSSSSMSSSSSSDSSASSFSSISSSSISSSSNSSATPEAVTQVTGFTGIAAGANGTYTLDGNSENGLPTYSNGNGWYMFWDGVWEWIITDTAYDNTGNWSANGGSSVGDNFGSSNSTNLTGQSGTSLPYWATTYEITGFTGDVASANGIFTIIT